MISAYVPMTASIQRFKVPVETNRPNTTHTFAMNLHNKAFKMLTTHIVEYLTMVYIYHALNVPLKSDVNL